MQVPHPHQVINPGVYGLPDALGSIFSVAENLQTVKILRHDSDCLLHIAVRIEVDEHWVTQGLCMASVVMEFINSGATLQTTIFAFRESSFAPSSVSS